MKLVVGRFGPLVFLSLQEDLEQIFNLLVQ
ncbi:MAG: hypothetical protein JWM11_5057 [Planctomycetaceae bacterium]|nr:hypothetical protein [Planctomycetaceae bacterium]